MAEEQKQSRSNGGSSSSKEETAAVSEAKQRRCDAADCDCFFDRMLLPERPCGVGGLGGCRGGANNYDDTVAQVPQKETQLCSNCGVGPQTENTMDACFKSFDKDEDNSLNINEFTALIKALFRNEKGKPYPIDPYMCTEIFNIFNKSGDGSMNKEEFTYCWNNWIKKIVRPVSALIVIDVQNDFISGSLAITNCPAGQNGEEVVQPINKLIDTVPFDLFCYSLDWHPQDHISFAENVKIRKLHETSAITDPDAAKVGDTVVFTGPPKTDQKLWPAHCVQETWGAEFHKDLVIHPQGSVVHKGTNPNVDSYSAFFDNQKLGHTNLEEVLRSAGITDVYVCGIATDVCVAWTTFHAQELGFRTVLIDDCSRGIDSDAIKKTFEKVKGNNGLVIQSSETRAMVQGRDRRVELGYQWALEGRKGIIYPPKNKNSKYNPPPPGLNPTPSVDGSKDDNANSNGGQEANAVTASA